MRNDVSLNNYPIIIFNLGIASVDHPAHSKERCEKKTGT